MSFLLSSAPIVLHGGLLKCLNIANMNFPGLLWAFAVIFLPQIVLADKINGATLDGPVFLKEPNGRLDFSNSTGTELQCKAKGNPSPIITWTTLDGSPVIDIAELRHVTSDGTLVFSAFSSESYRPDIHSVGYKCYATNPVGVIVSRDMQIKAVLDVDYDVHVYDEFAIRGNTAILKCHIPTFLESYVAVEIWIKDDAVKIEPTFETDGKYWLSPQGHLYIRDVTNNDRDSTYKCQTRHKLTGEQKISTTAGRLVVTDPRGNIPPKAVDLSNVVTVEPGKNAFLPCVAYGFPLPTTNWIRRLSSQDKVIKSNGRCKIIPYGLLVVNSQVEDSGTYVCYVNSSTWTTSKELTLNVNSHLRVHIEPRHTTVDVSHKLSLKCHINGQHSSVTWLKDGMPLDRELAHISHVGSLSTLEINSATTKDKGMYQCFANNGPNVVHSAVQVSLGDFLPELKETFSSMIKEPDSSITLHCTVIGNPVPTITWMLDTDVIKSTSHVTIEEKHNIQGGFRSTLHINKAKHENGGLYTCEGKNRLGKATHSAKINIYGPLRSREISKFTAVADESMMLSCPIYGYPVDTVEWLKDSFTLPTSVRQQVFANGSLAVKSVAKGTSDGEYYCTASNEKGESVQAKIEVVVMVPPKIQQFSFQDELLREGMRARLQCVVSEGDSPVTMEWLKDGQPIDEDLGIIIKAMDEFSSILAIKLITPKHNGLYTCMATNAAGTASHSAPLAVNAPPKIIPFNFQDDQNFKGMRAHITCAVSQGDLPITFQWLKDNQPIHLDSDIKISGYDRHSQALSIESVSAIHSGNYTCIAKNPVREASYTAQLLVQVRPHILPFAFQDKKFSIGGNIAVACMLTEGDPPITFNWIKDGVLAETLPGVSIVPVKDFSSMLTISSATSLHSGNYTCIASNVAATAKFTAELRVNVAPKIVPFSFGGNHYFAGVLARVSCVVYQGDLPLTIRWLKDGHQLEIEHGVFVQTMDEFTSVLTINNITSKHSGNYTCIAQNMAAAASFSSQLTVKVPPKIVPFSFQDEQHTLGMFVRISCVISRGDLPIEITWLKDELEIPSKLGIITRNVDEYSSLLSIDSLNWHHNGNYTCLAQNAAASARFTAPLVVNVPPRWVQIPDQVVSVVLNEDVYLHCEADGFPVPKVSWTKGESGVVNGGSVEVFPNGTLLMRAIKEEQEGYYVCVAQNGIGHGIDRIVNLKVYDPPQILVQPTSQTVRVGEDVTLSCITKGDIPLNITWFKDDKLISGKLQRYKARDNLASDGLTSDLLIDDVRKEDGAAFTCLAQNAYGEDKVDLNLLVQSPPDMPIGITVDDIGNQSVQLTWKRPFDGNSDIEGYVIEYKLKGGIAGNKTVYGDKSFERIGGLRPSETYWFRMYAINSLGYSLGTEPIEITIAGEAPAGAPQNVNVQALDSQTVKVSWQPPPRETWNGAIRGYNVGHRPETSSDSFNFQRLEVPAGYDKGLSFTITDLHEFTKYAIVIQAFNDIGKGPLSHETLVMTSEDVPSKAPLDVRCTTHSSNKIMVSWKPPPTDTVNGILRGYRVLLWPVDSWDGKRVGVINSTTSEATLENLEPFTNYSFQVVAYTHAGDGLPSKPIYCRTWEDVPDSPADVKCSSATSDSVAIYWMPPENTNGQITHYIVYIEDPSNSRQLSNKITAYTLRFEAKGLKRSLRYKFWVTASSVLGEGKPSQVVYCGPVATSFVAAKSVTFGRSFKVLQGAKLSLPCPFIGVPTPEVQWFHGPREIAQLENRVQVLPDNTLQLSNIQSGDHGNYTCHIKNDFGEDSISHFIVVQVSPPAPVMSVIMATFNSVGLRWKLRTNGDSPVLGYILKFKPEYGSWETVELQPYQESHTLRNLRCGTTYDMTLAAFNEVGVGETSEVLIVSTDGGVPVAPPTSRLIEESTSHIALHLDSWVTNGCPILYFTVEYRTRKADGWTLVTKGVKPNQKMQIITELTSGTWYTLRMTAHSTAGTTVAEYDFSTLSDDKGGNFKIEDFKEITGVFSMMDVSVITPIIACVLVIIFCLIATCVWVRHRRRQQENEHKSRILGSSSARHSGVGGGEANATTLASLRRSARQADHDSEDEISPYAMVRLSDFQRPNSRPNSGSMPQGATGWHQAQAIINTPLPTAPPMSEAYGAGGVYPTGMIMMTNKGAPTAPTYSLPKKNRRSVGETIKKHDGKSSETTFVFPGGNRPDGDYDPPPEFKWPFPKQ